ncbi:PQQ-dependent sugar dehydrogenase [Algoriphagus lutimaris]|uniref:PQQ-dependent sugar dehydrogenase n=1 Tax=Algoriphagus lutimaris TaxID=613197 RepID=UPI00196B867F|nr:PQQ-dependent sugar dehydrogenase [Algoriphagus lutimaris]MBN3520370.1 PQQ-dependent sugar dehydrogenase [Algoriphagus lutimaris]
MQRLLYVLLAASLLACNGKNNDKAQESATSSSSNMDTIHVELEEVIGGLENPVQLKSLQGSDRLFIVLQGGKILLKDRNSPSQEVFLDITDRVDHQLPDFTELGLLGLEFHPNFEENGRLFAFYSHQINDDKNGVNVRISEFTLQKDDSGLADPDSERVLMELDYSGLFIIGGNLSFGPDGMLYIGVGTGKSDEAKWNAQNLTNVFGSILRIDVDKGQPYSIPEDNPFVNGKAPEIWAYGFRNPYRFDFDSETGALVCIDVGDRLKEEVNIITKGGNYGWPLYEGTILTENQSIDSINGKLILPAIEYDHILGWGEAIVGSFQYRGNNFPVFQDKVLISDWSGQMFLASDFENPKLAPIVSNSINMPSQEDVNLGDRYFINGMMESEAGEIYLTVQKGLGDGNGLGSIFRIKY